MSKNSWYGTIDGVRWVYFTGLVLSVIKKYMLEHDHLTYLEFKKAFPKECLNCGYDNGEFNNSFLISVTDYERSSWPHKVHSYYRKETIDIEGVSYYFNGEWVEDPKASNSIVKFEQYAIKTFGYDIKRYNKADVEYIDHSNKKVSLKEYERIANSFQENQQLERKALATSRKEQSFLRNYLFKGKKEDKCGICGRTFPVNMLVTSHIKLRSSCTNKEKLDYKNIVMPMCSCGCDAAYEKGYLFVDEKGFIRVNDSLSVSKDFLDVLNNVKDKRCAYFNEGTKSYFKAHKEQVK